MQTDLIVPAAAWADLDEANTAAKAWCEEVNARVHTTTMAGPDVRLVAERKVLRGLPGLRPPLRAGERRRVDKMSTVRFGSARYSVPRELVGTDVTVVAADGRVNIADRAGEIVAEHRLVAPGECSLIDDHYGGPRRSPARAVRARTGPERAFLALGPPAEGFLRAAAATGTPRLAGELAEITGLEAAWGRDALVAALERATTFRRFKAADVRSILAAGPEAPKVTAEGGMLDTGLPQASTRDLSAYRLEALA